MQRIYAYVHRLLKTWGPSQSAPNARRTASQTIRNRRRSSTDPSQTNVQWAAISIQLIVPWINIGTRIWSTVCMSIFVLHITQESLMEWWDEWKEGERGNGKGACRTFEHMCSTDLPYFSKLNHKKIASANSRLLHTIRNDARRNVVQVRMDSEKVGNKEKFCATNVRER